MYHSAMGRITVARRDDRVINVRYLPKADITSCTAHVRIRE